METGMDVESIKRTAKALAGLPARAIVGIDGVDGAGKTTFADLLAEQLVAIQRPVLRASVDRFHNPSAVRYARGRHDPHGYFLDSYNYKGFLNHLIIPFKRGDADVLTSIFDHKTDSEVITVEKVGPTAILIVDGIFLHRDELSACWHFSIFLAVPFATSYARMAKRDGSDPDPRALGNARYYKGQRLYLESCRPEKKADLVIRDW